MKKNLFLFVTLFLLIFSMNAQDNTTRIEKLGVTLDSLVTKIPGLSKTVDISISSTDLATYLRTIASANSINISVDPSLKNDLVTQSFSNAIAKNVLLNLCKEYSLTIDAIGNILSVKKYISPYITREIPVSYNKNKDLFTADIQNDSLAIAFRKITDVTGKNLVFSVGLSGARISSFIKDMPFDAAIDKIALANQLEVTKTKDNFYLFKKSTQQGIASRRSVTMSDSYSYKIKDTINQVLKVSFFDAPIQRIIDDVAYDLKVNMATNKPLKDLGKVTIKSDSISFNVLLDKILEDTQYSYKLEDGMYFFGEIKKASVENVEVIPLMNRSIQLMMEPLQSSGGFSNNQPINNTFSPNGSFNNNLNQNRNNLNGRNQQNFQQGNRGVNTRTDYNADKEALKSIFPKGVIDSLNVKTDVEQNSFIVQGNAQRIEKFKKFIKKIDKSVPLIMIEVMLIEVNKSASVSAGIDLGIGENPVSDGGTIIGDNLSTGNASGTNLTLGAKSINRVIGGLNGISSLNLGKVVPNFYARIQALETNGDLKIKSTPKLSALNGHVASLTNGQTTYYTQTLVNTIGVENPQTQEFVNLIPIDANLSIKIRPIVSGDGSITLSIDVQQSTFSSGPRVTDDAPPNINTRKFTSTVRAKDQDVVILGGLEVDSKSDSGSGVPLLARIPIIKWLFSKRVRTAQKSKLSILIKPTVIR